MRASKNIMHKKILTLQKALRALGLEKEALECYNIYKSAMPVINNEYVSPGKVYGDFVYTLKLENLDENGRQVTDEDTGGPIYKWYVGETVAPLLRIMEHKTVFKKEDLEPVSRNEISNYIISDLISGSKYTLRNKVLEIVNVNNITDLGKSNEDRRRMRLAEENVQRALLEQIAGKGMVYGGHYKPNIEILNPENIIIGAETDPRKITEAIYSRNVGVTDFDIMDTLNSINSPEIMDKDIQSMQNRYRFFANSQNKNKEKRDLEIQNKYRALSKDIVEVVVEKEITSIDELSFMLNLDQKSIIDSIYFSLKESGSVLAAPEGAKISNARARTSAVEIFLSGAVAAKRNGALDDEHDLLDVIISVDNHYNNISFFNFNNKNIDSDNDDTEISEAEESIIRDRAQSIYPIDLAKDDIKEILRRAEGYKNTIGVGLREQAPHRFVGRKRLLEAVTKRYIEYKILSNINKNISDYQYQEPKVTEEYYDLLRHHEDMTKEFESIVGPGMSNDISTWTPSGKVVGLSGALGAIKQRLHILWLSQIKCIQDNNWDNLNSVYPTLKKGTIIKSRTRARNYLEQLGASEELVRYLSVLPSNENRKTGELMQNSVMKILGNTPCL